MHYGIDNPIKLIKRMACSFSDEHCFFVEFRTALSAEFRAEQKKRRARNIVAGARNGGEGVSVAGALAVAVRRAPLSGRPPVHRLLQPSLCTPDRPWLSLCTCRQG